MAEIDMETPSSARVYDYLLGGEVNFAADREAALRQAASFGGLDAARAGVRANRRFLDRAVRYLAGVAGVRQFLDIGTGIPNDDNVHGVAQSVAPDARIVCVDNDPVVLAHSHELMHSTPEGEATFLIGDVHEPEEILDRAAATLDFTEPVAVMLVAILHHVLDEDDPYGIVARLLDRVPPGSYLAISHLASDIEPERMTALARSVPQGASYRFAMRTRDEVARFFAGLDLVEPGLVSIDRWHPAGLPAPAEEEPQAHHWGAVARKPA
jgi:S-adenosyl methyltransferase